MRSRTLRRDAHTSRYKVYSYEKRGKRNYTVTHVKTKAEKEEEKAAERMKHHKEVFPFMRMTNVVRQKDGASTSCTIHTRCAQCLPFVCCAWVLARCPG